MGETFSGEQMNGVLTTSMKQYTALRTIIELTKIDITHNDLIDQINKIAIEATKN